MNKSRGRRSQKKKKPQITNALLWASCCSRYSVHQGGRRELLGVGFWGRSSMTGKSQGLSFCHVVSFLISGLISHWRLVPFTPIYYFLRSGSWWIWISVNKLRVCLCAHLMLAWVYVRELLFCVCEGATLSWLFQISLPHGSAKRGSQEGGREREREIER